MSIEILRRATADTDYTIAYIDGRPAAISEKRSGGGQYAFVEDRECIYNENGVRRQRSGPAPSAMITEFHVPTELLYRTDYVRCHFKKSTAAMPSRS